MLMNVKMKTFKSLPLKDGDSTVQDLLLWLLSMKILQDFSKSIQFEFHTYENKIVIAEKKIVFFFYYFIFCYDDDLSRSLFGSDSGFVLVSHVADAVAGGHRLHRSSHNVICLSPALDSDFDEIGEEDLDFSFCDFSQDSRNHDAADEFLNVWRHHHHCASSISPDW